MIRSFPACRMVGCGVIAVLAVTALPSRALNGGRVNTGTDPQFDTALIYCCLLVRWSLMLSWRAISPPWDKIRAPSGGKMGKGSR